ncbi:hypothetical protein [Deminuibacter soli]|uniref:Transporter n=1 Tax=Deminuibacter soli TaxID=2291815 RepID=A0A3E1ND84_9BACT|nr:hypothetical protein [Deminuibacter soli]RFM25923.1 hypothetical protein DXN05_22665 [Deminuibacter soli]
MKKILAIAILACLCVCIHITTFAQGCVAIRSTGGLSNLQHASAADTMPSWSLNINNRYFKSFRHYVGKEEQKQRQEQGTEVINHAYAMDLALTHNINQRWSVMVDVPIISNARSSLYEHGGKERRSTHSFGVGDIRFAAYAWLLNPAKMPRGNVQVGLGIKLPTGDYKFQDYFYGADSSKTLGPVDQSIQLGDGGTGITGEINAWYNFSRVISVYGNFYYLSNPREQNGVSSARGAKAAASAVANGSDIMSVPDQFMIRAGVNFHVNKWSFSAGVRDECLPVHDLIGGSNGFRRPGYIISAEPGVNYTFKKLIAYATVPVALVRNRTQSVPDKITTQLTGVYKQGDAAFADYVVNVGVAIKL